MYVHWSRNCVGGGSHSRQVLDHWCCWDGLGGSHDSSVVLWHRDVLDLLPAFTRHSNRVFRDLRHGYFHSPESRRQEGTESHQSTIGAAESARGDVQNASCSP